MSAPDAITTTHWSPDMRALLNVLPTAEYENLAEIFSPVLALNDEQLLHGIASPGVVQLRMTAYLLRQQHHLIEQVAADSKTEQLLLTAALQCRPLNTRRKT